MKISRRLFALAVSAVFLATGVGIAKPAPPAADDAPYTIAIKDFMFTPQKLTVPVGSKVTWINKDEEPHKVASVNGAFVSSALDTDEEFTFEFKTPGKYEYFCTVHPQMTAEVVVESK